MAGVTAADGHPVSFLVAAPGPNLNPSLHAEPRRYGAKDMRGLLDKLSRAGRIETGYVDAFEVIGAAARLPRAEAWRDYMTRKYVNTLEFNAGP